MNDHVTYETDCPNNHNQAVRFTREEFEAALKSDTLIFHCNTCDTDWSPTSEDMAKLKKHFAQK